MCRKGDLGVLTPTKKVQLLFQEVTVDEKGVIQTGGIEHNPVVN